MGTRVRFATWKKVGRLFVVRPPGWPKDCELSFTDQKDMIEWAHNNGYVLKLIQQQKEVSNWQICMN